MRVSVVITCYRRREFLRFASASVLDQSLPRTEYEVIVLKDWTDESFDRSLEAEGVRVLNQDLPIVGDSLRKGLTCARGEVVSFLDDDDAYSRERLAEVAKAFEEDPHLALLRNGFEPIGPQGDAFPAFRRVVPQPDVPFSVDPARASARDFARVVRTRAYGNLSTMSFRRAELVRRANDLPHIEASTDASLAILMMDADGHHRFDPRRWTRRRVGSSIRTVGTAGEGRRAVSTLTYLRERTRRPYAREYADLSLAWAKVDASLNSPDGQLPFGDWLRYVYYHRSRWDAHTIETEAWGLAKWAAPRWTSRAYLRRRARWGDAASRGRGDGGTTRPPA